MKSVTVRRAVSAENRRSIRWTGVVLVVVIAIAAARLTAQTPGHAANSEATASAPATPSAPVPVTTPNYALEARFLPDSVNKLVFDLSVTPHWFTQSDRFWYSYRTSEGTKYYVVDPAK